MVVLFAEDFPSESTRLRRAASGAIVPIVRGVWTDQVGTALEEVVAEHWRQIVAHIFPGAVITGRTGFEHAPESGNLFIAHSRWRPLILPGLAIHPDGDDDYRRGDDIVILEGRLFGASTVRALIDNAETRGRPSDPPRRLSREELEMRVATIITTATTAELEALAAAVAAETNAVSAALITELIHRETGALGLFTLPEIT